LDYLCLIVVALFDHSDYCRDVAGHYERDAPSDDLVSLWKRLQGKSLLTDEDSLMDKTELFNILRNGILFPIWRMHDCDQNDSGRGAVRLPVRGTAGGKKLNVVWHTTVAQDVLQSKCTKLEGDFQECKSHLEASAQKIEELKSRIHELEAGALAEVGGCAARKYGALAEVGGCAARKYGALAEVGGCAARKYGALAEVGVCAARKYGALAEVGGCAARKCGAHRPRCGSKPL